MVKIDARMKVPLKVWVNFATPRARNMVRKILAESNAVTMTTQEIYAVASSMPGSQTGTVLKDRPERPGHALPQPPDSDHPIHSMRYLKKYVLEDLAARNEVVKVHIRRGAGGVDEQGTRLDLIKAKGKANTSAFTNSRSKETWSWRLVTGKNGLPEILEDERGPIPRVGPMVPDDKMLEEDEGIDMFDDDGWTKERLKFVNVPVIDTRKLHY